MTRAEQREHTRKRIVVAAVAVFAERGFEGASTRLIAARADTTQGLVTYHFASKDDLWRAAADHVFGILGAAFETGPDEQPPGGREVLRRFVEANAAHPEVFHFIVDAGRHDNERMRWLVDHHLRERFEQFVGFNDASGIDAATTYYAVAGASSLIFCVGPECRRLTGADPTDPAVIDAHVDLMLRLFAANDDSS
ncbi:MAG: TetR/AcrR family transcriptional regulator [Actinomycetota bacterium]